MSAAPPFCHLKKLNKLRVLPSLAECQKTELLSRYRYQKNTGLSGFAINQLQLRFIKSFNKAKEDNDINQFHSKTKIFNALYSAITPFSFTKRSLHTSHLSRMAYQSANKTFHAVALNLTQTHPSQNITRRKVSLPVIRHFHSTEQNFDKAADSYVNPIDSLQEHVEVPLLPAENILFNPSLEEMKASEEIFVPKVIHPIQHLKSVVKLDRLPELPQPEVAFIGRSNVGKSSLIKYLFRQVPDVDVRTSKKPGHTRVLQMFKVSNCFTLVDMPGYGYNMPDHFHKSVEQYLKTRRRLVRTFLLIDASVGLTNTDEIGLNMLEEFGIPYVIVLTKVDKSGDYKLVKNVMDIISKIKQLSSNYCLPQPFLLSSITGEGFALFQCFICYITGSVEIADKHSE
ncbi:GTP-binding protein 8 [Patella vulgata]|uniref:GTP-binding protein 8 n=1 Tax=Patella vulgata TaxID=6465 RepID=UPI002180380D|nr:GTP-binding protein 8 [Patella vulgata]